MSDIRIDPELKSLIPKPIDEEYFLLEDSIRAEGCREPLMLWGDILVDGHNRLEICAMHGIPYETQQIEFPDRTAAMIWMIDNQRGRRNLSKQAWLELGFKRAELLKPKAEANLHRSPGPKGYQESDKVLPAIEPVDTLQEAADYAGVSRDTAAKYKRVMEDGPDELREEVKQGTTTINKAYQQVKPKAPVDLQGRDPQAFSQATAFGGDLKRLHEYVKRDPGAIASGFLPQEVQGVLQRVRELETWLTTLRVKLSER